MRPQRAWHNTFRPVYPGLHGLKVTVNVQCPVCHFFHCLGGVERESVEGAIGGSIVPFLVDYRVWTGGRAKGVRQLRRLERGYIPVELINSWLEFKSRIEFAYRAINSLPFVSVFRGTRIITKIAPGRRIVIRKGVISSAS